jgi:hypothetical protein
LSWHEHFKEYIQEFVKTIYFMMNAPVHILCGYVPVHDSGGWLWLVHK